MLRGRSLTPLEIRPHYSSRLPKHIKRWIIEIGGGLRGMSTDHTFIGKLSGQYGAGDYALGDFERDRHLYILGRSGSGKSTLIHNLAVQDILAGRGLCLIDPHGDLAEGLLDHIPRHRTRDVVFLDLADTAHPIAWNPLENQAALPSATVAFALVSACKHIWRDSWGPRMEYVLANSLQALIEAEKSLILLPQFLTDAAVRQVVLERVSDLKVRHFFEVEFAAHDTRTQAEIISPIQNKIGQLLLHKNVRQVLAMPHSSINLPFMMDNRRILIVSLAKGQIGEEPANLFGCFLVSLIGAVALARSRQPGEMRVPFCLYVDEFQNVSTEAFASLLSEARKFKLQLVLAHQFLSQTRSMVRDAVLGNVGTKILFSISGQDSEVLRHELAPYGASYLEEAAPFTGLVRTGGGEAKAIAFYPPIDTRRNRQWRTGRGQVIREESRRRFSVQKSAVERTLHNAFRSRFPRRGRGL